MRTQLNERNRRIIDAVIARAGRECPGALAMVGVYGSFATGDVHPKSDLDLLILINDDRGYRLAHTFIQNDLAVGHDLYCTTWASLERDAAELHPHIAKLMEADIVWCADQADRARLEALRASVRARLAEPLSAATIARVQVLLDPAERLYAEAMLAESLPEARLAAGRVVSMLEEALLSLNHRYFRRGVRRAYDELSALPRRPDNLCAMIDAVAAAPDADTTLAALTALYRAVRATVREAAAELSPPQALLTAAELRGSYEEIFSNWRNKMYLAAETGDRHLAFCSMTQAQSMFVNIDLMAGYDPDNLAATARAFDVALDQLEAEYARAELPVCRYPDIDAFLRDYRKESP